MKNAGTTPSASNSTTLAIPTLELNIDDPCTAMLNPEELEAVSTFFPIKTLKKGDFLLKEGQIATTCHYVYKGCIREYYLIDGIERTTEFYMEGDALSSNGSRKHGAPAKQYWECIEDTTVSVCTYEKEMELYRLFPRLESICRMALETQLGAYQAAMAVYMCATPEERYLNVLKNRPGLLDRVPQYQLASYIGVKPESLSRIRGRIRSAMSNRKLRQKEVFALV